MLQAFEKHVVTLDQFLANPLDIASSPELYVSVDGDVSDSSLCYLPSDSHALQIYRWQIMAPAGTSETVSEVM